MRKISQILFVLLILYLHISCQNNPKGIVQALKFDSSYQTSFKKSNSDEILVDVREISDEFEKKSQKLFLFDSNEKKCQRVYATNSKLMLKEVEMTSFDINDFIAYNMPFNNSQQLEICHFQNQNSVKLLLQNGDACILLDSKEDNLIFFYSRITKNKLFYMNRDGSKIRSIEINGLPLKYHRLDKNHGCIEISNYGERFLCLVNLIDQQSTTLNEPNTEYNIMAILVDKMIIRVTSLKKDNTDDFYFFDFYGNKINKMFTLNNTIDTSIFDTLYDSYGNRFFYTYRSKDDKGHIVEYDCLSNRFSEIFSHTIKNSREDYSSICLQAFNKKKDFISFVLKDNDKEAWFVIYLKENKVEEINLPINTKFKLSTDGEFIFCIDISDEFSKNGILKYNSKQMTIINKRIRIDFITVHYIESTQEFLVSERNDNKGNQLHIVNVKGKIQSVRLEG
ncbi:MAG: hypothetical protein PHD83_00995 [Caldisericia bacterium]|nr:hypothetical protein [Caldisericia bacterium]